jgi:outer membrane receptor protein involved in Fe transport
MTHDSIRNAVRLALTAGVAASFVNAPAFAEDDDAAKLDRVEVTGSRIKRTQLEGAMPVTSVTREQIEKTGISSIGDLLQELPAAGAALNTNFNNGGDGSTRIDLRNLGPNRALVLVNGRRWVNAVGGGGVTGSVDLNTIPLSIIERIEVLKDGASAVYGSDAIAGVVNIITRRDFDGAQANAQVQEYDEGDGHQELYDFSVGASSARASVFMNASYYKAEPVAAGDRAISKEPSFGTGNDTRGGASTTTPNGRALICDDFDCDPAVGPGGLGPFEGIATRGSAADDLTPGVQLGDFRPFVSADDAYNFAPDNYLATPQERWSIYAQARYDVTDSITFTAETLYSKRRSEQLLAAMPVVIGELGNTANGLPIGVAGDNPFNPFPGRNLNPDFFSLTGTDLYLPLGQRRFVETGGRSFNQDVDLYRFGGGFEGSFELAGRVFDWNLGYTFSEGRSADITFGLLNTAALATALGPIAACTAPCVPLNFFGGSGSITQAMLNYVTFNAHDFVGYDMRNYTANVSGELIDLPAGPLGIALGYEWRKESGFDDPDALIAAGNTTGNARSPTFGSYKLDEFFTELAIPLLAGAPFAEVLELQVAARHSDYSTFGSTTNTKFGFRWEPITDLLVRGTYQEGFRAPNIGELFLGASDAFPSITDPCSNPEVGADGNLPVDGNGDVLVGSAEDAQLVANCFGTPQTFGGTTFQPQNPGAAFVPGTGAYGQTNSQIRVTIGGSAELEPETADSTTFGFVYSPGFVDGLSVSLDWYRIEIQGAIAPFGAQRILDECYGVDGGTGGAEVNVDMCDFIVRRNNGSIEDLVNTNANVNEFKTEGLDLNVVWRAGELPLVPGEWKFTWDTAYVDEFDFCAPSCDSFVGFNSGDASLPAFKSNLDVEWSQGDWEAVWRMRFIGAQDETCNRSKMLAGFPCSNAGGDDGDPATAGGETNYLGATTYHNAQVSYHLADWDARFTLGMQNIGGKSPPLSSQAFANSFDATTYEIPGRIPYFRVTKTF